MLVLFLYIYRSPTAHMATSRKEAAILSFFLISLRSFSTSTAYNSASDSKICEETRVSLCKKEYLRNSTTSFTEGQFNWQRSWRMNWAGDRSQEKAAFTAAIWEPLVHRNCYQHAAFFLCSVFAPFCYSLQEDIMSVPCYNM